MSIILKFIILDLLCCALRKIWILKIIDLNGRHFSLCFGFHNCSISILYQSIEDRSMLNLLISCLLKNWVKAVYNSIQYFTETTFSLSGHSFFFFLLLFSLADQNFNNLKMIYKDSVRVISIILTIKRQACVPCFRKLLLDWILNIAIDFNYVFLYRLP